MAESKTPLRSSEKEVRELGIAAGTDPKHRHHRRDQRRPLITVTLGVIAFIASVSVPITAGASGVPPAIDAFAPSSAPAGTPVVISGSGFAGLAPSGAVTFGGVPSGSYRIDSQSQVTATVPSGATTGPITITSPDGVATSANQFGVTLSIVAVGPSSGPVGTPVVIQGVGFVATGPVRAVRFGSSPSARYAVDSDGQITARIPEGATDGPVAVVTDAGTVESALSLHVTLRHIVMIVMENRSLGQIDGNASARYINNCLLHAAAGSCPNPATSFPTLSYSQMYAATQAGSMYDYLDLTSGSDPHTQGKVCKFSILGCPDTDANIVDQLESAGLSWASYAEDYPTPGKCSLKDGVRRVGSVDTVYTSGHVPYLHYTDIRTNPARCTHFFGNPSGLSKSGLPIGGDAGLLRLTADLTSHSLPAFSFITPNQYSDMHTGCSSGVCPPGAPDKTAMGDLFLAYWIPHLMAGLGPDDRIVVTWDESTDKDNSGCCLFPNGPKISGGHIPTFVVGGNLTPGVSPTPVTAYSTLTAVEEMFSLPGMISNPTATQTHQLNQLYGTCDCTPRMHW